MKYTIASREFYISPGITCLCEIPVPDLAVDPDQAPALGNSYSEKEENLDMFLSEIFFPQYIGAIKRIIANYQHSALPAKYLYGLHVHVTSLPRMHPALYHLPTDMIIIDPDTLSIGFGGKSGKFVFGHEFGHRIIRFSHDDCVIQALKYVYSILPVSNQKLLQEVLCDAFASLISGDPFTRFDNAIDPIKQKGLNHAALQLAWSC